MTNIEALSASTLRVQEDALYEILDGVRDLTRLLLLHERLNQNNNLDDSDINRIADEAALVMIGKVFERLGCNLEITSAEPNGATFEEIFKTN